MIDETTRRHRTPATISEVPAPKLGRMPRLPTTVTLIRSLRAFHRTFV
jgi:hypothetical protein